MKPMLDTIYNCGCGFKCKTWPEAARHISETTHIMTMTGTARLMDIKEYESSHLRQSINRKTRVRKPAITSSTIPASSAVETGGDIQ